MAVVKNPSTNAGDTRDTGSIPGLERSPRGGNAGSSMLTWRVPLDKGAWWAAIHRVAKIRTQLK